MFRLAKLIEALEHLQQRLLRDFLGVLPMAAHQVGVLEQLRPVGVDEAIERVCAPRHQLQRELSIRIGRYQHYFDRSSGGGPPELSSSGDSRHRRWRA